MKYSISGPHCVIQVRYRYTWTGTFYYYYYYYYYYCKLKVWVVGEVLYLWTSLCHTGTGTHGQGHAIIITRKMVPITGRASSFRIFGVFKTKLRGEGTELQKQTYQFTQGYNILRLQLFTCTKFSNFAIIC